MPYVPIRQHMRGRSNIARHTRAIPSRPFIGVLKKGRRKGQRVRINPKEQKTFQIQIPRTGRVAGRVGSQSLRQRVRIIRVVD